MTFALGIVAHHDRAFMADKLMDDLDADFCSMDDGHLGPGTNHRIVWSVISDANAEWSVVIEEDAQPVPGFRDQLDAALITAPAPIVSLYLGRLRPPQYQGQILDALQRADEHDAHWITSRHCLHAVALAVKTELVPDMLAKLPMLPIDQAIGTWARKRGHQIAYSVPSLVDHADGPTLIRHPDGKDRPAGRVAWRTGTRDSWLSASTAL